MPFFLIRHLPTSWNSEGRLQGRVDIPILPPDIKTIEDIRSTKKKLTGEVFDAILTSGLIRTKQTAELYGYHNYKVEPLVNELDFGPFEGKPKSDLLEQDGGLWLSSPADIALGETMKDFEKRLRVFIDKNRGRTLLVFSHGAVIRALKAIHEKGSITSMNTSFVKNNELVVLEDF